MDDLCKTIERALISDNKNLTEAIFLLSHNASKIAAAIIPPDAIPANDAWGGHVSSLTESVMGMTGGLMAIAGAIENLADALRPIEDIAEAIRERNEQQTE